MCKVKYEACDGRLFDNKEECKEYNDKPRVYVILCHSISTYVVDVVLTKEEAEAYINDEPPINRRNLTYKVQCVSRYKKSQKIPISDPHIIDKDTYISLWDKIKQKVFKKDEL